MLCDLNRLHRDFIYNSPSLLQTNNSLDRSIYSRLSNLTGLHRLNNSLDAFHLTIDPMANEYDIRTSLHRHNRACTNSEGFRYRVHFQAVGDDNTVELQLLTQQSL